MGLRSRVLARGGWNSRWGNQTEASAQTEHVLCVEGGSPADFELRLQYKITGGNSGIQYRSIEMLSVAKWVMKGYQADIDAEQSYTGQIYEERGRGFLALRGQTSYAPSSGKPGTFGSLGDSAQLKQVIRTNDWNDLDIVARGNTLVQLINGRVMSALIDDDAGARRLDGEIGIQLHVTETGMKIETRRIRIRLF